MNFEELEQKWIQKWEEAKIFEANPDKRKKFFVTFPYPYMNGFLHLGHFYTLMRVEALARYKRLKGFNVLFPQGWHCTGSPIENAAQRIREKEEKQWKIMRSMGFSDDEIRKFEEPVYWTKFFPVEAEKDYRRMGFSVDFRRSFITTDLNPHYDKFVAWQFNKLKEKKLIATGRHPVVWCTKDNSPVPDHSRLEGEGETPQEFTLIKLKFGNEFLIAATLRPETIFGVANVWVDPETEYVKAGTGKETWIISRQCAEKLKEQDKEVDIVGNIKGKELLGKKVFVPLLNREVMILPSDFCDSEKGTGIVMSVPSDAPDDWMGLYDLQKNDELCKKYGLDKYAVREIKPIPIIMTKDLGDFPAVKVCTEMEIESQHDREKLDKAKNLVYRKGFYTGFMNENCGKYNGLAAEKAKDLIRKELLKSKNADIMHELTGKVVCRCLTPSIVKIVSNQWFIKYSDKKWKKEAHSALKKMKLYPEKSRQQFDFVIDWLNDWACTREYGLGSKLPWDKNWVIESLSDSTIYMAYYTVAHLIKNIPIDEVNDELFDYVFLSIGEPKNTIDAVAEEMRKEFEYWYPVDFRNSAKDLVQNHLTFFIFNHTAIFPKGKCPKGIGVNGYINVDGQKMAKSLGNFMLLRELPKKFGVDASRFAVLSGGEGIDDINFEQEFAKSMSQKLESWYEFCIKYYNSGSDEWRKIDDWMDSALNSIIITAENDLEETLFRSASQKIFFDMQRALKWYLKRTVEEPNKDIINQIIESQIIMMSPFTPFICEELWGKIGKKGFVASAKWPNADEEKVNPAVNLQEQIIQSTIEDINSVLRIAKIRQPKKIILFVGSEWKYLLYEFLKEEMEKTRNFGDIIKALSSKETFRRHMNESSQIIQKILKSGKKIEVVLGWNDEKELLKDALLFLKAEFNCSVEVVEEEKSLNAKAKQALPRKFGVFVE